MQRRRQSLPVTIGSERDNGNARIFSPGRAHVGDFVNRYNISVFPFTVGVAGSRVLPGNPSRTYLLIQNISAANIFVNFGQNASATNGIRIIAGGNYEQIGGAQGGGFVSPQDVYITGAAASLSVIVAEGLYESIASF